MTKKQRRDQVILIVLSVFDLLAGVLSIVFSALSVQILAAIASGATLFKAVKIAITATKATNVVRDLKPKLIAITILKIFTAATRVYNKNHNRGGYTRMKNFFKNVATKIKNNPITLVTIILEALAIGFAGGCVIYFQCFKMIPAPWDLVVGIACTVILYVVFAILTIYLGYDNEVFAAIRKTLKTIGGKNSEAIITAIDAVSEAVKIEIEKEKAEEEAKKAAELKAKEDEEIWAKIQAEEEAKKAEAEKAAAEAAKKAKIEAYRKAHPTIE